MSIKRILALIGIFLLGVGGWNILGMTTQSRSADSNSHLGHQVARLWGGPIRQQAPSFFVKIPGTKRVRQIQPAANTLQVDLDLEFRRKGLVWYPVFISDFSASYVIANRDVVNQKVKLHFPFPDPQATYDRLNILLDDTPLEVPVDTGEGINAIIELAPEQSRTLRIGYRTRGLREWSYRFDQHSGRVRGLEVTLSANFKEIDFQPGSLSPTTKETTPQGVKLYWKAEDLITSQYIGLSMPERLNPGPLSARLTFFAPVCLLFFFVLIASINVVYRVNIHPMHYLFVTAGFFTFHLLFAYLVDIIYIHLAFWISAATSMALVILYLRSALGKRFPWRISFAGQLFYLVLFSYSFFLEGYTGLTVTLGSVATLAILMKVTAQTDWEQVFAGENSQSEEE